MEIIERKEALELGLTTYYTGRECKHGHIAKRNTKTGVCCICSNNRTKVWRCRKEEDKYVESYNSGKPLPDKDYLDKILHYEEESGKLYWKYRGSVMFKSNKSYRLFKDRFAGKEAGYQSPNGYVDVGINNYLFKAHRVIWKMVYGEDPATGIDHINGVRNDNRVTNLRLATAQENARNSHSYNSTGYKGVTEKGGNFTVQWCVRDTPYYKNGFKDKVTAAKYYDKVVYALYGEFAKLNFPEDYEEKL